MIDLVPILIICIAYTEIRETVSNGLVMQDSSIEMCGWLSIRIDVIQKDTSQTLIRSFLFAPLYHLNPCTGGKSVPFSRMHEWKCNNFFFFFLACTSCWGGRCLPR